MATAIHSASPTLSRRREILDWHSGLRDKAPAQVLGLPADAEPAAVKAAFTSLAKRFHPDVLGEADADLRQEVQAIFIRITEAYREMQARPASRPRQHEEAKPRRAPLARERVPAQAPATGPLPAPELDEGARRARVEEALAGAAAFLAGNEAAAAVGLLHEVVALAQAAEKGRIRRLLARAYVAEPTWRRYGVSLLAEILRESPDDAEALATLGVLYQREGLTTRAEATLRRAVSSDPQNREARARLREVTAQLEERRAREHRPGRRGLVARLLSFAR